jgi:tetratricopeptide (TPR) repeat protein
MMLPLFAAGAYTMQKVFISYSHKDEDWKNRLQTHLAVLEMQELLSVWDDRKIAGGEDWYPEIEQAIQSAHVAILLISADFLSSKFIQGKEVPPLLQRRKNEGLRVIPLILKPCAWQAVEWLSKIQGRPIDNQPLSGFDEHNQDHHLKDMVLEIKELLSTISSSVKPEALNNAAPSLLPKLTYDPRNSAFLVPYRAKGKFMVGRDVALGRVRQQLLVGKPTSIGQTALFQGIGGLGKTQLAVEYAYHYRAEYPNGVYWITADENIDSQLTQIAVAAKWIAPESEHSIKLDVARHRLKNYSDCLIVFDNLESADVIREYIPNSSSSPHILVTSRREQSGFTDVKLELLDVDESYLMLVQESERTLANEEEKSAAREISTTLSGLPLALELAGAYLARRPISWFAYRDLLQDNLKQALPTRLASLTEHEADLFKTLSVSEQDINEEPLLADVLDLLTWSGSSPMSLQLIAPLLGVQSTQLYGALSLGVALRILQKVPDTERYSVHRLVQEVRRQDRPLSQRDDWINTITQRLGNWFEEIRDEFRDLPVFELELDHLRAWQIHAELFSPIASVRLLWLQAYPAYHRGHFDEAYQILQLALKEYEAKALDNQPLKANLLHDTAYILFRKNEFRESLKIGEEALRIRQECFNEMHPDTAMSLNTVANIYRRLGNLTHALELAEQALKIRYSLWEGKHKYIATSLSDVAVIYSAQGDQHRAIEESQKALDMEAELYGSKHISIARSLGNNSVYHFYLGDYPCALELGEQSLEMFREFLGDKHPDVAHGYCDLATFHSKLGNYPLALELRKRALDVQREILGESHPDAINTLQLVAKSLYRNPFTASDGRALVEDFLRNIPRDHPSRDTVLGFLNSLNGFRKQGKIGHSKKRKKK